MIRNSILRQALRATPSRFSASNSASRPTALVAPSQCANNFKRFTTTPNRFDRDEKDPEHDAASTSGKPGEYSKNEGQYARTDNTVRVDYPEEDQLPRSTPLQGRGGVHTLRTLASFSMEGKTAVVTGGARGLGLVMAQALCTSGADVAIVDMNRACPHAIEQLTGY